MCDRHPESELFGVGDHRSAHVDACRAIGDGGGDTGSVERLPIEVSPGALSIVTYGTTVAVGVSVRVPTRTVSSLGL